MNRGPLVTLRDLLRSHTDDLTFADLPEPLLEDLAVGWFEGHCVATSAAEMLSLIDGLPVEGRDEELAGRAVLTLLSRHGVLRPDVPAERVYLLGSPEDTEGDTEAVRAFGRREEEYDSLATWSPELMPDEFAEAATRAFEAARTRAEEGRLLPDDDLAAEHTLALLGQRLPAGLRAWFHERHGRHARGSRSGPRHADAMGWKFVLVGRALLKHREEMVKAGVPVGSGLPERLLGSLLALDLGDLARTALLEPA
jgi:hypothetical protein